MRKLLLTLIAAGLFAGSAVQSADVSVETYVEVTVVPQPEQETGVIIVPSLSDDEQLFVNSMGSFVAAAQVVNTCVTMPIISRLAKSFIINSLINDHFLALCGGVSVGFLTSIVTEQLINFAALKSSKQYGASILTESKAIMWKYIPTGLIGFFAFLASLS